MNLLTLMACTSKPNIQKIKSFQEVDFEKITKDTLVVFDIDDTLITASDVMARKHYFPWWFRILIGWKLPQLMNSKNWEDSYSIMWQKAHRFPVETFIVKKIEELKNRGIIVIALTSMESGAFGRIDSFPRWRYEMLKDMKIIFSTAYPDRIFNSLKSYRGTHPILYKGILCANQRSKGEVLGAFIKTLSIKPKMIISFDDDENALCSIQAMCQKNHIMVKTYHYLGTQELPGKWSAQCALKQIEFLAKYQKWISDDEARKLIY